MSSLSRCDLLRVGIATPAAVVLSDQNARDSDGGQGEASGDRQPADVAQRLATLRARPRHLGPPSALLLRALERTPVPVLVYDLDQVEENFLTFLEARKQVQIRYAVKCCPNPHVLRRVALLGGGFDVASPAELDLALAAGAPASQCVYSNIIKSPGDIRHAFGKGVHAFVADSEHEVRKLAENAPKSKVYIRLLVRNDDSAYPLRDKFGTSPDEAARLLRLCRELGLEPYGTHFHVGTQCYNARAWEAPARAATAIFRDLAREGIELKFFDIGGGFPAPYPGRDVPTVKEILTTVCRVLEQEIPGRRVTLAVEPGRALVATAGAISSRLLLRAHRADAEWLYLDVGIYNGLCEARDLVYPVTVARRSGPVARFTLCGPTCDDGDMLGTTRSLPASVTEGDLFVFDVAGAYSEALFTRFNGIETPAVFTLDQLLERAS